MSAMEALTTVDGEVALFRAIMKHRPVGPHRHFAIIPLCRDLEEDLGRTVPPRDVWKAMTGFYDLDAVNDMDDADSEFFSPTLFSEFQLPIHPALPPDESFLSLVDSRRLASDPSPPSSPVLPLANLRAESSVHSSGFRSGNRRARSVRSVSTGVTGDRKDGEGSQEQDSDLTDPDEDDEEAEDEDASSRRSRSRVRRGGRGPGRPRGRGKRKR